MPPTGTVPHDRAGSRIQRLRLVVVSGRDAGLVWESSSGRAAVGSASDNELVLHDPEVSRYHLELEASQHGVVVKDLGSLNGTFAGDVRVHHAVVRPGIMLGLGSTMLRVEDAGTVSVARQTAEVAGIVGVSSAIGGVSAQVIQLAPATVSTLIQGETGSGKEVVARAIHELGSRRAAPFVVVDCGSMPATLIASELFGHERGAFTGADTRHVGAFEHATGGTIFLDEIGELPLAVQPALLGVLERKRFRRVGGRRDIDVDVRVIAATNRDLRAEANRGMFRPDLYYRLAVARIVLPPLRDRVEDIEPLVAHFVEQMTGSRDVARYFSAQTIAALQAHPWNGNVRELRNVIERALAMGEVHFEHSVNAAGNESTETLDRYRDARAAVLDRFERDYLGRLMTECKGNASEASRRSGMDRPYLLSLLKRRGLR